MPYRVDSTGAVVLPLTPVSGVEAIAARLSTRLRTQLGTWPTDVSVGIDWDAIRETGLAPDLQVDVRAQLEADPAVVSVDAVDVVQVDDVATVTTACTVTVDGITTPLVLTVGPDPYATRGAPAWYLASGAFRYTRGAYWGG